MSADDSIAEIAALFIDESQEGLDIMESNLLNLDLGAADAEIMNTIFRAAHSIKGGGATFGFTDVSEFAHHVETLLDAMRIGDHPVTQAGVDLLLRSVDCLRTQIDHLGSGESNEQEVAGLVSELEAMMAGDKPAAEPSSHAVADATVPEAGVATPWLIDISVPADGTQSGQSLLNALTKIDALGNTALTLAGADSIMLDDAGQLTGALTYTLAVDSPVAEADMTALLAPLQTLYIVDAIALDPPTAVAPESPDATAVAPPVAVAAPTDTERAKPPLPASAKPAPKSAAKPSGGGDAGSIRVNINKIDALINLVGELVITQSMLSRFDGDIDASQLAELREGLSQLYRNTRELQESVMAIRMLPISFAFNRFPRLVRDTGNALGKRVDLALNGEQTELDKTVLEKIGDPLVHLVRNSLDHGIETPEARRLAGKPETGTLELNAFHEGGNIVIEVRDDGAGIDRDKVLGKAIERGLVGPDETLTDDKVYDLIFRPGFSTADNVSDLSGRGVGMDVVRRNIADLGGTVSVVSTPGEGSVFTIQLPLTLAILDGQLVRVGDESYIVPLVSIVETIQSGTDSLNQIAGGGELFRLRDEYLPVVRLHALFGIEPDSRKIEDGLLVVVESGGKRIGILVDDLQEQQQVVIKSLEANYRQTEGISGATILGDGRVALILDVPGLMHLFFERIDYRQDKAA